MPLLKCTDLTLGYENIVLAEHLDFEVNRGEYWCIVGENGTGKSTLMKNILGLRKPLAGTITYGDGLEKTEIGYLPQQTQVQRDFPASVTEVVISGFQGKTGLRPFYNKKEKEEALHNMERLGITDLSKRCYRELSGGQQQRVLLARALCAARKMILLDEPVTGLDPKATNEMYELIDSLNKKDKITVIMVSHDMNAAVRYASHILHVGRKQLFFGTKEDYLTSKTGQAFLAVMGGDEDE